MGSLHSCLATLFPTSRHDDRHRVGGRPNGPGLPAIERRGDPGGADPGTLGGPDRAVELVPSTPLLQLVPLPYRLRAGDDWILDLDHREDTLRHPVVG